MTASDRRFASLPTGIRAICVVDAYLLLVAMAFSMMSISQVEGSLAYGGTSLVAAAGFGSVALVALQLWVLQGVWRAESWAWPAGLAMFGVQALAVTALLLSALTGTVPVDFADGTLRWIPPLLAVVGCGAYLFGQREWFRDE